MDQIVQPANIESNNTIEIVVHITETLGEPQRKNLTAALEDNGGITAAEFCPLHYHLMLVRYDKGVYSSRDVLDRIKSQNVDAQLIGPI
jgi:hypothetical protein